MICPFCKERVEDGSIKCHHCREFIVPQKQAPDKSSYSRLQFYSDVVKGVSWPFFLFLIVFTFRGEISELSKRAKSLEIGSSGVKSDFADYASAFGYVQTKVGQLAVEQNPARRQELSQEIQSTAEKLKGLHPLAMAMLIDIGRGVARDDAWKENAEYLFELKQRGFVTITPDVNSPSEITTNTFAHLTDLGDQFLNSIGYTNRRPEKSRAAIK